MTDEGEEKERLNNSEFGELIPHLPFQDLLRVEYRTNKWYTMITVKDPVKKIYGCNVCTVTQSGVKNLFAHVDGKKHKLKMDEVKQLYHPEYTYAKGQSVLAAASAKNNENGGNGNINDASTTKKVAQKPLKKTNTPIVPVVPDTSAPTTVVSSSTKTANSTDTAVSTNIGKSSTTSTTSAICKNKLSLKTNIVAPATSNKTKSKPINTAISKHENTMTKNVDLISTNSEMSKDVKQLTKSMTSTENIMINPPTKTTAKVNNVSTKPIIEKNIDPAKKQPEVCAIPIAGSELKSPNVGCETSNVCKITETQVDNTYKTEKVFEHTAKLVKNPFALKPPGNDHKNDSQKNRKTFKISCVPTFKLKEPDLMKNIMPDVIVIEDDFPTDSNKKEASVEKGSVVTELSCISSKDAENTEPVKDNGKPIEDISEDEPSPKRQKVVDPAAAFSEKSVECDKSKKKDNNKNANIGADEEVMSNKPRYQSNIVIIPTAHKINKIDPMISHKVAQPKFSSKTFSSKPSDNDIHGLIGVEYVVKILKSRQDQSPRYECGLCELVLDGFAMQSHLVGYNHRLKFCEKHFPTAIRQYRQYMGQLPQHEVFKVMTPILAKLAIAIEQHHGRDLPYECLQREFNVNRHEVLSKVFSCRHASEQYGPTFTHVIDSKEIDEYIAQRHTFQPQTGSKNAVFDIRPVVGSSSTSNRSKNIVLPPQRESSRQLDRHSIPEVPSYNVYSPFPAHPGHPPQFVMPYHTQGTESVAPIDDATHKLMVEDFLRGNKQGSSFRSRLQSEHFDRDRRSRWPQSGSPRSNDRNRNRNKNRSRTRSRSPTNLRFDKEKQRKSISPLRNNDIWQAYRHLVDQKIIELNNIFKEYRDDPETHPMYNEEWQKFWKRRKDELIAAGLDHRTYNYQPEWVRFVKVRIEELFSQDVENIKIQSRERLCLPMTNHDLGDAKYHVQVDRTIDAPPQSANVMKTNTSDKTPSDIKTTKMSAPGVVPVLRLMTALEEYLGSLGPKIIDLLSKALQTEKNNPERINSIVLTVENCTLLETAMEKFKGLMIAGLLEGSKERALKKAIHEIETLLILAEKDRTNSQQKSVEMTDKSTQEFISPTVTVQAQPRLAPVASAALKQPQKPIINALRPALNHKSNIDRIINQQSLSGAQKTTIVAANANNSLLEQVDKTQLATKLAAALTAQGKTDFDPQQLQQIIAVYALIERKNREASALTTATETVVAAPSLNSISIGSRKALSDTLADFLNPSPPSSSGISFNANTNQKQARLSNPTYSTQDISNYVDMMRRSQDAQAGANAGGSNQYTNSGINMWPNQMSSSTSTQSMNTNELFGSNMYLTKNDNHSNTFCRSTEKRYSTGFNNNRNNIIDQPSMNTLNASRNYISTSTNRRLDSNNISISLNNQQIMDTNTTQQHQQQQKQQQQHQQQQQQQQHQILLSNSFGIPNIHDMTRNGNQQYRKNGGGEKGNPPGYSKDGSNTYWRKN